MKKNIFVGCLAALGFMMLYFFICVVFHSIAAVPRIISYLGISWQKIKLLKNWVRANEDLEETDKFGFGPGLTVWERYNELKSECVARRIPEWRLRWAYWSYSLLCW